MGPLSQQRIKLPLITNTARKIEPTTQSFSSIKQLVAHPPTPQSPSWDCDTYVHMTIRYSDYWGGGGGVGISTPLLEDGGDLRTHTLLLCHWRRSSSCLGGVGGGRGGGKGGLRPHLHPPRAFSSPPCLVAEWGYSALHLFPLLRQ